jgi:hypothetical protein
MTSLLLVVRVGVLKVVSYQRRHSVEVVSCCDGINSDDPSFTPYPVSVKEIEEGVGSVVQTGDKFLDIQSV